MATNPEATIRYHASNIILNVHSNASFHSASRARSRAGGYYFLGDIPQDDKPIKLNGAIYVLCTILKLVAASAAEAELGALFLNAQEAKIMRLTLKELGHSQPPTPIHIDNSTCVGIVNNTQKRTRSRAMENKYFWLLDGDAQGQFKFHLHPGQENLGDYPSKAHSGAIHRHVRPFYLHTENSPRELPRAAPPSSRRGCAETLGDPYCDRIPLPRIPGYRKLDREARISQSVNFASATQELTTPTPKLADIVNSLHALMNVHGSFVANTRRGTKLPKCATPTNLRYIHNLYRTLERR